MHRDPRTGALHEYVFCEMVHALRDMALRKIEEWDGRDWASSGK
jgi:hypothetical protein